VKVVQLSLAGLQALFKISYLDVDHASALFPNVHKTGDGSHEEVQPLDHSYGIP
jgi:hypothetical protein